MNKRQRMADVIGLRYGLKSPRVLSVMSEVSREVFVPKIERKNAYLDGPVPIGYGQTMSQPYTVAFMTHLLLTDKKSHFAKAARDWRVLEVGSGSGYQAAVLSRLVGEVYTVEIIPELAKRAESTLRKFGYNNVYVHAGSGEWGWSEHAPYDAIIVTCGVEKEVPKALFDQLKIGGVLVAPVGKGYDKVMTRYKKLQGLKTPKFQKEEFGIFHFVPFVRKEVRN